MRCNFPSFGSYLVAGIKLQNRRKSEGLDAQNGQAENLKVSSEGGS
jgi:hypothetical protein